MSYTKTTWVTLDVITAAKANNWETQYDGVFDSSDKSAAGAWTFSKNSSAVPTIYLSTAASYAQFGARGVLQPQASDASLVLGYNLVKRSSNWKNLANAGITYLSLSDTTITLGVNASPGSAETTFTPTDRMSLTSSLLTVSVAATLTSTLGVAGDVAVNTNKFTVAAASGNTVVAGTLGVTGASTIAALSATSGAFSTSLSVTGDFAVNTNKFTAAAATGNTVVAGTLAVGLTTALATVHVSKSIAETSAMSIASTELLKLSNIHNTAGNLSLIRFSGPNNDTSVLLGSRLISAGTGASAFVVGVRGAAGTVTEQLTLLSDGSLNITGDFSVATNKFTVAAASGNTNVAGTLGVTGACTFSTTVNISAGGIVVNTSKFNVDASNGNVSVNTNKFTIDGATGNTLAAGTLSATGNFAINTNKFTVTASSGATSIAGVLTVACSAAGLNSADIGNVSATGFGPYLHGGGSDSSHYQLIVATSGDVQSLVLSGTGALRLNQYGAGILKTDSSGNVTASTSLGSVSGTFTGNLTGNVTGNVTGNASTATHADSAAAGDGGITDTVVSFSSLQFTGGFLTGIVL